MIAPSSSSPSDQLALVSDRLECLQELSVPLTACNGEHLTGFIFSMETSLHLSLHLNRGNL